MIGKRHLEISRSEPLCRVVAVADPRAEVSATASGAGAAHYPSHGEMLDGERLDGVIVACPTQLHAPIGLELVQRGVPTLMEKPFTDSVESGLALARASKAAGIPIAVGHHRRFDPAVAEARRILASGEIGRLVGVSGIWAVRKPDAYYDVAWRREIGGGPVLINIIHDIDMLRHLCGEVRSVYSETTSGHRNLPVEDGGAILIRFASGALAALSFSDAAPSPWGWERATGDNPQIPPSGENCYRFFGSSGSFEFPEIRIWRCHGAGPASWSREIAPLERRIGPRAAIAAQLRSFCRVILGEATPAVGPEDGLATLAAAEAVIASSRSRTPVAPAFSLAAAGPSDAHAE